MLNFEAFVFEISFENIATDIGPEIADVSEIIYGMPKILKKDSVWPACIYAHKVFSNRLEYFLFSC